MFSNELIFMNVWCKGGKYLLIRQVMFEDKKYCDNLLRSKENTYVCPVYTGHCLLMEKHCYVGY